MEIKRLVKHTRQLVAQGQPLGSNLWHTALHAEHARPMFQVCHHLQCPQTVVTIFGVIRPAQRAFSDAPWT